MSASLEARVSGLIAASSRPCRHHLAQFARGIVRRKSTIKEIPMLSNLALFVEFVLGFVPLIAIVLTIVSTVWAATKLSPTFEAWFENVTEKMFGTDKDYDERHETGYAYTSRY
jgi:hypothetical protein